MSAIVDTVVEKTSLSGILLDNHYEVDYYQREYAWDEPQVIDLLNDLTNKFKEGYSEDHSTDNVKNYPSYFLGSLVTTHEDGVEYIVDGQQRLTTLTLLYLFLSKKLAGSEIDAKRFVFSSPYGGEKVYNIRVEDRKATMDMLISHENNIPAGFEQDKLVINYKVIQEYLDELPPELLLAFYYWLSHKVYLIKMKASNNTEAYTLFETMNDRGKPLTPIDMLKGYLLQQVKVEDRKETLNSWVKAGKMFDTQEKYTTFLLTLFKAKWAVYSISDANSGGRNDWSFINSKVHKWIRENEKLPHIQMDKPDNISMFIKNIPWYAKQYIKISNLEENYDSDYKHVCYNHYRKFPAELQKILILGVLDSQDSVEKVNKKIKLLSTYWSIRSALSAWNGQKTGETNLQRQVGSDLRRLRTAGIEQLDVMVWQLKQSLVRKQTSYSFEVTESTVTGRTSWERDLVRSLFAAILDNLPNSDERQLFSTYVKEQVEHLLTNKSENNADLNFTEDEYFIWREHIGGLALLPSKENASLKDASYVDKVKRYTTLSNPLVSMLSERHYSEKDGAYVFHTNPSLNKFLDANTQLVIKPYPKLDKTAIKERASLYSEMCKIIWDLDQLEEFMDNEIADSLDELEASYSEYLEYEDEEEDETFDLSNTEYLTNLELRNLPVGTLIHCNVRMKGGMIARVDAIIAENNKINILKLSNAAIRDRYTPMGSEQLLPFEYVYNYIINHTPIYKWNKQFYDWEGKAPAIPPYMAIVFLTGGSGKTRNWNITLLDIPKQ